MMKMISIIFFLVLKPFLAFGNPLAQKGSLDLSHWSGRNNLALKGEWLFFPNQLIEPSAAWKQIESDGFIPQYTEPGLRFKNMRKGTYLLRIKTNRVLSHIWFGRMEVYTSARVFVFEGPPEESLAPIQELGSASTAQEEQEIFIGQSKPFLYEKKLNQDVYLLIQVADFHHYWSGLWVPPSLAMKPEALAPSQAFVSCVLAGILFFAFAHNISLSMSRRHDAGGWDMTVISGMIALRVAIQAFYALLPERSNDFLQNTYETHFDVLYTTVILGTYYFYRFVRACFPIETWPIPEKPIFLAAAALCIGLFLLPMADSEAWLLAINAYLFFVGFGSTLIVIQAVRQGLDEAWISMLGIIILFAGGLSSLSWTLGNSSQVQHGFEIGFAAFIYCETQVLSRRFVRTLHLLEKITQSLDAKDYARTLLLQNASRDLRTPLNGILGFLELIQREHYGSIPEPVKSQLSKAQRLTQSLKLQVDAILDLADVKQHESRNPASAIGLLQLQSQREELSKVNTSLALVPEKPNSRVHKPRIYSHTFHILVIGDNADDREMISEILSLDSHRVSVAVSESEGLMQLESLHPDLVLIDVMSPSSNGEDLVRRMKSEVRMRDIPIMFISARATEDDRLNGLQLGVDDYLVKPLIVDELRLRVGNLLDRLELHRVLADQEQKDKMAQLGDLLADLSHEMKNIYQSIDSAELKPAERLKFVTNLLPLPAAQRRILGEQLPQRAMDSRFHERENWLSAPDRKHPCYRDLRYLRFSLALLPMSEAEARTMWSMVVMLKEDEIITLSQCLHLLANHLQLVDVALRSGELIEAVLGFNRNESEHQVFKLSNPIEQTLSLVEPRLRKNSITLDCQIADIEAQGSSSSVQQIVLNLISNAIDVLATADGPDRWIKIQAEIVGGQTVLTMTNSGPPIGEELRVKLFGRGFTTKGKSGSGIGLFVSRRLAQRMHGHLELAGDSQHTCFVLTLPAAPQSNLAKAS